MVIFYRMNIIYWFIFLILLSRVRAIGGKKSPHGEIFWTAAFTCIILIKIVCVL